MTTNKFGVVAKHDNVQVTEKKKKNYHMVHMGSALMLMFTIILNFVTNNYHCIPQAHVHGF